MSRPVKNKIQLESLPAEERIGTGLMLMFFTKACTREEMTWIAKLIKENWKQKP